MPDDDRYTRDRVRTLDRPCRELRDRATRAREAGTDHRQMVIPEGEAVPLARRALDQTLEKLGRPDLPSAARETASLARTLKDQGPDSLDLCAGQRASGLQALLDRAVSVVLSSHDPDELLGLAGDGDALAELIGEQFVRGVLRRYGIDRVAPFGEDGAADMTDALDLLELTDLTFTSTILRALAKDLLR